MNINNKDYFIALIVCPWQLTIKVLKDQDKQRKMNEDGYNS